MRKTILTLTLLTLCLLPTQRSVTALTANSLSSQSSGLVLGVSVSQDTITLGSPVTVTGTVTNTGNGTKHITFEIISYSACEAEQHADLFYNQDYIVPAHTTKIETVTFTPECGGEWDAYTAMIYHNSASEVETSYDVVP